MSETTESPASATELHDEHSDSLDGIGSDVARIPEPDVGTGGFLGTVKELWKMRRVRRRRQTKLREGYVEWYLLEGGVMKRNFVQPKDDGGGVPKFKHDGGVYLFPRDAVAVDETTGMNVCFHRKGEAEPINPRERREWIMGADELADYLEKVVTKEPPSMWDALPFSGDPQTMVRMGVAALVVFAVVAKVMAG